MTSISVFRALLLATLWAIIPVAGAVDEKEAKPADPKQLVADSWQTLGNFLDDEKHVQFREQLPQAKAILIVPRLVRGGFILGGSGGRGVVLTQDAKSKGWSQPAFVSVGSASVGWQAGAEVAEMIFLIMTKSGFKEILDSKIKFGARTSIAAGGVGKGIGATAHTDVISFVRGKGLYGGLAGEGMVVNPDAESVKRYYGNNASTEDILVNKKVYSRDASKLVSLLTKAAKASSQP